MEKYCYFNIKKQLFIVAFVLFVLPYAHAQYQEEDSILIQSPQELEIVITAMRAPEFSSQTHYPISTIATNELQQNGARSLPEGLVGVPGVWMQKTNHGGGSAFIRGLTGNQTLLMIDGVRMNNSTYRYGPNQYLNTIEALQTERVEVLRGAGSVQYGSDAIGGVIQVLTPDISFKTKAEPIAGSVFGKYLSGDMEKSTQVLLKKEGKRLAVIAGAGYRDFGDLIAGGDLGGQAPSGYLEKAAFAKGLVKLGDNADLTLAYNGVRQEGIGRYDQVAQRGYEYYDFDPQIRHMSYMRLRIKRDNPFFSQVLITPSFQYSFERRKKKKAEEGALHRTETDIVNTVGFTIENHSHITSNWLMVSGVEYYGDIIYSRLCQHDGTHSYPTERGLYPDDSRATSMSVFSLSNFSLNKIQVQAGLRYHYSRLKIEDETFGNTDLKPQAVVGNLSVMLAVDTKHRFGLSANTGFRAPNINDMSSFGSFDFGIEVPASDLSPEKSLTFEGTYNFTNNNFSASVVAYRTKLYDLISREKTTYLGDEIYEGEDVYKKVNVDEAIIQGFEVEASVQIISKMKLNANLSYTYGENIESSEPLRRIPPLFGTIGWSYNPSKHFSVHSNFLFAGAQTRLSPGDISDHRIADGGTDAWQVVNVGVGYKYKRLQFNQGINNIFNEAYRMHGSGVDGMGRSVWTSVKWSF